MNVYSLNINLFEKTETCIRVQTMERESQHTSKFYEQKTLNAYSQIAIDK